MIEYTALTQKGKGRKSNQDRILIENQIISSGSTDGRLDHEGIAVICDGVGGEAGGEYAAELALREYIDINAAGLSPYGLLQKIHSANRVILEAQNNTLFSKMATTIAGIIIYEKSYFLFNIGDTRTYLFSDGRLQQKSRDHVKEVMTQEGNKTMLYCYLGADGLGCHPSIKRGGMQEKECLFLICSDGVWNSISPEEISVILSSDLELQNKREAIVQAALHNGSMDDLSIILLDCHP